MNPSNNIITTTTTTKSSNSDLTSPINLKTELSNSDFLKKKASLTNLLTKAVITKYKQQLLNNFISQSSIEEIINQTLTKSALINTTYNDLFKIIEASVLSKLNIPTPAKVALTSKELQIQPNISLVKTSENTQNLVVPMVGISQSPRTMKLNLLKEKENDVWAVKVKNSYNDFVREQRNKKEQQKNLAEQIVSNLGEQINSKNKRKEEEKQKDKEYLEFLIKKEEKEKEFDKVKLEEQISKKNHYREQCKEFDFEKEKIKKTEENQKLKEKEEFNLKVLKDFYEDLNKRNNIKENNKQYFNEILKERDILRSIKRDKKIKEIEDSHKALEDFEKLLDKQDNQRKEYHDMIYRKYKTIERRQILINNVKEVENEKMMNYNLRVFSEEKEKLNRQRTLENQINSMRSRSIEEMKKTLETQIKEKEKNKEQFKKLNQHFDEIVKNDYEKYVEDIKEKTKRKQDLMYNYKKDLEEQILTKQASPRYY